MVPVNGTSGFSVLESIMRSDLGYSLRRLAADPVFTVVAVLALAIGIGGNTALFAAVNVILLRTLPFDHPDTLVEIDQPRRELPLDELSQSRTLAGAAAF